MTQREIIHQKACAFFEGLWRQGDPWELESAQYEQAKYAAQREMIAGRRYERVLEIGCGAGVFTRDLAALAEHVTAVDISAIAIERARRNNRHAGNHVEFRVVNIMESELEKESSWDLIVMSETVYYLGWLYSFFDVAWLAARLFDAVRPGGRFLMANTFAVAEDYLCSSFLIHTYRDLFVNVGFHLEQEQVFSGEKNGTSLKSLHSLLAKKCVTREP